MHWGPASTARSNRHVQQATQPGQDLAPASNFLLPIANPPISLAYRALSTKHALALGQSAGPSPRLAAPRRPLRPPRCWCLGVATALLRHRRDAARTATAGPLPQRTRAPALPGRARRLRPSPCRCLGGDGAVCVAVPACAPRQRCREGGPDDPPPRRLRARAAALARAAAAWALHLVCRADVDRRQGSEGRPGAADVAGEALGQLGAQGRKAAQARRPRAPRRCRAGLLHVQQPAGVGGQGGAGAPSALHRGGRRRQGDTCRRRVQKDGTHCQGNARASAPCSGPQALSGPSPS